MEYVYRSATNDDLINILLLNIEIHDKVYRTYRKQNEVDADIKYYLTRIDELKKYYMLTPYETKLIESTIIVTTQQNEILGYIAFYQTVRFKFIDWLYIKPSYNGLGLGRKLLELIDDGENNLALYVHISNKKGQGFYEHMGFKKIGYNSIENPSHYIMFRSDNENIDLSTYVVEINAEFNYT